MISFSGRGSKGAPRALWIGYAWAVGGVAAATAVFWLLRGYLDKGQASLLYLPVVIACAIRFGFGPALLCALLSFGCWNFFFLPPYYTFIINDPKDWLSLFVFLLAALATGRLASQARDQARQARDREDEIATLFQASETISQNVRSDRTLVALTQQLQTLCHASRCIVFDRSPASAQLRQTTAADQASPTMVAIAQLVSERDQIIGFGQHQHLWTKALAEMQREDLATDIQALGAYLPLHVEGKLVGVLFVGRHEGSRPFSAIEERLIRTLANHAAVVLARDALAAQAAQAEALREADTLKDGLISLVSHELRTPLASIKATVTGLLDPRSVWDDDARAESLLAVDREADRLSAVVSNLLDLSRLEGGAWQPQKDWCDLAEIVGVVLGRLPKPQTERIKVTVADDVPLIRADDTQVTLVLKNLVDNALKYTPVGSPIHVSIDPSYNGMEEAPLGATIIVRDFGEGLCDGDGERIFERFYRGKSQLSRTVHGTGLGLSLCAAIVRAHGGRIGATNAPAGQPSGAVFTVILPLDDKAKPSVVPSPPAVLPSAESNASERDVNRRRAVGKTRKGVRR